MIGFRTGSSTVAKLSSHDAVVLDTGPLGLVVHPRAEQNAEANEWLEDLLLGGVAVYLPEIADYELRRELLRLASKKSIERLDSLKEILVYLPLDTETILRAAQFWADARRQGKVTAPPEALDGDVILAAQTRALEADHALSPVVATTNVGHLSILVAAEEWQEIGQA